MNTTTCDVCNRSVSEREVMYLGNNGCVCLLCATKIKTLMDMRSVSSFSGNQKRELWQSEQEPDVENTERKPIQIKEKLDEYIVSQTSAKKILSVAAYNHYKRTKLKDTSIKKSNVLLVGPTGCGKTYLVQKLAEILNVPLAIVPATNLTEAGYVGQDAESVVQHLLYVAKGDVEKTQEGIIFIDEIDKLTSSAGSKREVGGKGVQQALLPILEGTKVEVVSPDSSGMAGAAQAKVTIDTSNILFICGGAFPDVENIIKKRLSGGNANVIGFAKEETGRETYDEKNIFEYMTMDDLKEFGMIPEFLGRLPVTAVLQSLDVETLKDILYKPKDSLVEQYKKLFEFDGLELEFTDEALEEIAKKALEIGTGARSLRTIMENLLLDLMYSAPSKSDATGIKLTKEFVLGEAESLISFEKDTSFEEKNLHIS